MKCIKLELNHLQLRTLAWAITRVQQVVQAEMQYSQREHGAAESIATLADLSEIEQIVQKARGKL